MLKVKGGDLDKMGLLFERYHRPLYGFLFHSTHQKEASEDMVQNVFYRMLKYRHTFEGNGEFITWMYHLARNVLIDYAKKSKKYVQQYDIANFESSISGGALADEPIQKEQELNTLQMALSKLSPESREVLILSRFQELKYDEIAKILQISEGNVKVRVHRAMGALRNIMC